MLSMHVLCVFNVFYTLTSKPAYVGLQMEISPWATIWRIYVYFVYVASKCEKMYYSGSARRRGFTGSRMGELPRVSVVIVVRFTCSC